MSEEIKSCKNTDKNLFEEIDGEYYSPSCFMTEDRTLGINVGGFVIVKTLRDWFELAKGG